MNEDKSIIKTSSYYKAVSRSSCMPKIIKLVLHKEILQKSGIKIGNAKRDLGGLEKSLNYGIDRTDGTHVIFPKRFHNSDT